MPTTAATSYGAIGVSIGLSVLALLLWVLALATLGNLAGSDAAGNAYSQAYGAIGIILLWLLLAILMILACVKGAPSWPGAVAALILIPASGIVAMMALDLLAKPYDAPFLWPIVIPAIVPPLVVAFCFWALVPSMRSAVAPGHAAGFVWGATFILCVSIVPMLQIREHIIDQEIEARIKYDADLARLPAHSPLWDWTPFLTTRDDTKRGPVLDRIRGLERRQSESEIMLDRGDFPLLYLGSFDLDPTPALCAKARSLLRKRVAPLVLTSPNSKRYAEIAVPVSDAVAAMNWLVGYDCSCDAESLAWESMAKAYRDTNFDVYRLAELRDPKNLGRMLRESPARFSMLTQKAHLKAWLKFTDDKNLREQALAGARQLDHRTADAVDMLNEKYDMHSPWVLLRYLPMLDLEATAPLCQTGLRVLRGQFSKIYRPGIDDPRPYRELLERLGAGEQLPALLWLAGHGCDADSELTDVEGLVRAYQDSPDRAAMLAKLTQLRRRP